MSRNEILRNQRWRLGIIRHAEEVTHNVAKTCRYFGISRTAFYKWYETYQNYGVKIMSNGISNAFRDIGRAIRINFDNNLFAATLILIYSAIDAMAFLSMPANQREVRKPDFINWVESYMQTDSSQPYQYQGIDLYGARCGIIHRYGATSRLSAL